MKEDMERVVSAYDSNVLSEDDLDAVAGGANFVGTYSFILRHGIYIARLVKKYL